jgi:hypothetical protein
MQRNLNLRNRMREIRSSGTVGERGGNEPLYPEKKKGIDPRITLRVISRLNTINQLFFYLLFLLSDVLC